MVKQGQVGPLRDGKLYRGWKWGKSTAAHSVVQGEGERVCPRLRRGTERG